MKEDLIISAVCSRFNVPRDLLLSKVGTDPISIWRAYTIYLLKEEADMSYRQIARLFDSSPSIMYGRYKAVETWISVGGETKQIINELSLTKDALL